MAPKLPNPGSPAAVDLGCECPIMDNAYGKGLPLGFAGEGTFWIDERCPLHSVPEEEAHKFIRKQAMKRIGL